MSLELPPSMYNLLTLYEAKTVVMTIGFADGIKVSHGILRDGTRCHSSLLSLMLSGWTDSIMQFSAKVYAMPMVIVKPIQLPLILFVKTYEWLWPSSGDHERKNQKDAYLFPCDQVRRNQNDVYVFPWDTSVSLQARLMVILTLELVNMDDPNITIEEYIRLEEEKAHRNGKVYNWETATYATTSNVTPSYKPTVSLLNDNKIDFRISFDESDDEDYMVIYDENSFSYKIISVNNLRTDSENDDDKVNMPSFEPEVSYSNDLDFLKDFENEFPAIVYNDALTSKSDF
nr:hypothetical protein [Tanacetum cinerariifolium]